jgi:carbonic anhydrase
MSEGFSPSGAALVRSTMKTLIDGFFRFKHDIFPDRKHVFRELAKEQKPKALFITCADSRVVPDLITQSQPGDLFICRTVGNQVPPFGSQSEAGVSSSIEYAVQALDVRHIIVCGHSDCGAMKGVLRPEKLTHLPATASWLRNAAVAKAIVLENYKGAPDEVALHLLTEENVIAQIENLKTHPSVAARLAQGTLDLYGWLYHIHSGEITTYNAKSGTFEPLSERLVAATPPRRRQPMSYLGGAA